MGVEGQREEEQSRSKKYIKEKRKETVRGKDMSDDRGHLRSINI